ncbi:MAG: ParB family protein [Brachybacterium sp.]
MATTGKPRKSSPFAGGSPVNPPAPASDQSLAREERTSAPAAASSGKKYPPKVTFYQPQDDTARMRGAFRHTDREEGDRSLSDFIHKAVMAEVERREQKYNSGKPFPDLEAGNIPRGRPMGE